MSIVFAIVGAASLVYGLAVMVTTSGSRFFLFWYVVAAVLFAIAWALHTGMWSGLPVVARRIVQVAGVALVVLLAGTQVLMASHFGDQGEDDLDYIVVLGALVRPQGPSAVLKFRLDTAYDYLMGNERTVCIVSGGQGHNEPAAEADVMAEYLIARGVSPDRIIREDQATSTSENIELSMECFDPEHDRIGVVTNEFHLYRSLLIARKKGLGNVSGIAAPSLAWYLPHNMTRESFVLVKDLIVGNV